MIHACFLIVHAYICLLFRDFLGPLSWYGIFQWYSFHGTDALQAKPTIPVSNYSPPHIRSPKWWFRLQREFGSNRFPDSMNRATKPEMPHCRNHLLPVCITKIHLRSHLMECAAWILYIGIPAHFLWIVGNSSVGPALDLNGLHTILQALYMRGSISTKTPLTKQLLCRFTASNLIYTCVQTFPAWSIQCFCTCADFCISLSFFHGRKDKSDDLLFTSITQQQFTDALRILLHSLPSGWVLNPHHPSLYHFAITNDYSFDLCCRKQTMDSQLYCEGHAPSPGSPPNTPEGIHGSQSHSDGMVSVLWSHWPLILKSTLTILVHILFLDAV